MCDRLKVEFVRRVRVLAIVDNRAVMASHIQSDLSGSRRPSATAGDRWRIRSDRRSQGWSGVIVSRVLCALNRGLPIRLQVPNNSKSPTEPYAGTHFATHPTALIAPCIKAGSSARGCYPERGAPRRPVVLTYAVIPHCPNQIFLRINS